MNTRLPGQSSKIVFIQQVLKIDIILHFANPINSMNLNQEKFKNINLRLPQFYPDILFRKYDMYVADEPRFEGTQVWNILDNSL